MSPLEASRPTPGASGARIVATVLQVEDGERSWRFYGEGLGLTATFPGPPAAPGTLRLGLPGGDNGAWLDLRPIPTGAAPLRHGTSYGHLAFGVPDLPAAFARLAALSPGVIRAPGRMVPGGPPCAFIRDPDGFAIELVQTLPAADGATTAFAHPGTILGPQDGQPRLLHTNLRIRDVDAALRFYAVGLGMAEIERVAVETMGGVTSVFVGSAGGGTGRQLELACFHAPPAPWLPGDGFRHMAMTVADPAAIAERLVRLGFATPTETGAGVLARDGDGHGVLLLAG